MINSEYGGLNNILRILEKNPTLKRAQEMNMNIV
jgi:hypothetical protein